MKNNPSQISFNSISKYNEDYNSSITMNTINPNIANLSFRVKFETKFGQAVYIIGNIEELVNGIHQRPFLCSRIMIYIQLGK